MNDIPALLRRLKAWNANGLSAPSASLADFDDLHREALPAFAALRHRLFGSGLAWTGEDKRDAAEARDLHRGLADAAGRLTDALAATCGAAHDETARAIALTLFYLGEAAKCDAQLGPDHPHRYRAKHALYALGIAGARHRETQRIGADARPCTIEALYFRSLLLGRFASGLLDCRQLEILDSWIWLWMPSLRAAPESFKGPALRAALDTDQGLHCERPPRNSLVVSLPLAQLRQAIHHITREFHRGRVPGDALTSTLRIEDHVQVLGLVRRGLRQSYREPLPRAERHAASRDVTMAVGLAEILSVATAPPPPRVPTNIPALATSPACGAASRDVYAGAYEHSARRTLRLLDESETGFGLEGSEAQCGDVAVGDLVALHPRPDEPPVLGRVARCIAAGEPGRMRLGVRKLGPEWRVARVRLLDAHGEPQAALPYLLGEDASGRSDGFILSERQFARSRKLEVAARGRRYALSFNRVRLRGRGWVLAGFEVDKVDAETRPEEWYEVA